MYDIRLHGRGGQGAVICGNMLAAALAEEGKYALSFPLFAGDRRGGPVTSFVRVSNVSTEVPRCQIHEPDCLIIMHAGLVAHEASGTGSSAIFRGFREGGLILVNSARAPEELDMPLRATIATVNATMIAERHGLGTATARPVNTAILGALVRVTQLVAMASLEAAIRKEVPEKVDQNLAAARDAYKSVHILKEASHA
ncbi:MAG TPA: 2-oxoacid:acceptor oxidoreductase family protein [Burkholderiales bacterium]|nr:2-oxoacid:acceptor oxidoreductase family protein [Burkholderiales bacterium]